MTNTDSRRPVGSEAATETLIPGPIRPRTLPVEESSLARKHPEAFEAARHLIEHGVPLFVAEPAAEFPLGGSDGTGYWFPKGWQHTEPEEAVLAKWRPGWALCAVMGHVVDGLDRDPRNGGELPSHLVPNSYGQQSTPSGGTHDLIASLGVRSKDGVLPGIDVKAGVDGQGHGLLFLAPTEKVSKTTGEIGLYTWVAAPDLEPLSLIGRDDSGVGLADAIRATRPTGPSIQDYDGPAYENLTDGQKQQADDLYEGWLFDWKARLAAAANWGEGERDHKERGWEALTRDFAWALASQAVCPWTPLEEADAALLYASVLPDAIASDPKCGGKWRSDLLAKAASKPCELPPWVDAWQRIWSASPILSKIRDSAWAGAGSPRVLLGYVLARVAVEVPVNLLLPGKQDGSIGSRASLNFGVVVSARTGGGKSSGRGESADLLPMLDHRAIQVVPKTGEGMQTTYLESEVADDGTGRMKPTGRKVLIPQPRRLFVVDEIKAITQKDGKADSHMVGTLCSMLMGEHVGAELATQGASRNLPDREYRCVMVVGAQVANTGVLLDDEATGTPQRFLWVPGGDPTLPDERVADPGTLPWDPDFISTWLADHPGAVVPVPAYVKAEVWEQRARLTRGLTSDSESHRLLMQLKVATLLGLLHGHVGVTDQWWEVAGLLVTLSLAEQAACRVELARLASEQNAKAAHAKADAQVIISKKVSDHEAKVRRVAGRVLTALADGGAHGLTGSQIRRNLNSRDRDAADEAFAFLEGEGKALIDHVESGGQEGVRIRLA